MTVTGKMSRRRLREAASIAFWNHAIFDDSVEMTIPQSEKKQKLPQVGCQVLNTPPDRSSTDAAFARLGGDSITAMQVVSRCRTLNNYFTVADILRLKIIRALAYQKRNQDNTLVAKLVANKAN